MQRPSPQRSDYVQICGFEGDGTQQSVWAPASTRNRASSRSQSRERQPGDCGATGHQRRPGEVMRWQPGGSELQLSVSAAVRSMCDSGMMLQPVQQELDILEQKFSRQIKRLQEQSERFLDVMVQPLEAKVASLESRLPSMDCQLAELSGFMRGIQENVELQVRRTDAADTRCRKLRQFVEDELKKLDEVSCKMSELVTRNEIFDSTDKLKQDLKELVADAIEAVEGAVSRQELAEMAERIRGELSNVELSTVASRFDDSAVLKELTFTASSIRKEIQDLRDKALREEEDKSMLRWELQQDIARLRRELSEVKVQSSARALTSARAEAADLLAGINGDLAKDVEAALLRLTTVEEQQSFLRAQIAVLEEPQGSPKMAALEGHLASLKHQVAFLEERQAFMRAQAPALEKQQAMLKAQVQVLEQQQSSLQARLSLLEDQTAETSRDVEGLVDDVEKLGEKVPSLEMDVAAQLAAMKVQVSHTTADVYDQAHAPHAPMILDHQSTLKAQVALIELQQAALKAQWPQLAAVAEQNEALKLRIASLESWKAQTPESSGALKAEGFSRTGYRDPSSPVVASLPSEFLAEAELAPKLQSEADFMRSQISIQETAAAAAKAVTLEISNDVVEIRQDCSDLMTRMDGCESEIIEIKRKLVGIAPVRSSQAPSLLSRPPTSIRKFPNLAEAAEAMLGKPGRPQGFPMGRQGHRPEVFNLTPGVTPRESPDARHHDSSSDETCSIEALSPRP